MPEKHARIQKAPTWEIAPTLQEEIDKKKMPSSPGNMASPPLSPQVSPPASRGRKSGSGHRRQASWSSERPRANSFDDATVRNEEDSDSDAMLPTPAEKQGKRSRVRRFLRHQANVVKGGYKATKKNVHRSGRYVTKPFRKSGDKETDKAQLEIATAIKQAPSPSDRAGPALRAALGSVCAAALVVAVSAGALATAPAPRKADGAVLLATLISLFVACLAANTAADRLVESTVIDEEEDEAAQAAAVTEAPLSLVTKGQSDERGTWEPGAGADFAVRSATYLENGIKKPSAEPLYTVGVAGFAMAQGAVPNGSHAYPEVLEKLRQEDAEGDAFSDPNSPLPKYVMITMNSPLEAPSLRKKAEGAKTAVFVFALRRDDAAIARAPKGAVSLATQWLRDAPNDPALSGRLKGIFHAIGDAVPNLAKKWNGKPVLLAGSAGFGGKERPGIARFVRGADYLEVNVDVSESFTYIARGAIYLVTDKLKDILIKFAFVVEGRERDELPEVLVTAVDVHQFDWRACVAGKRRFSTCAPLRAPGVPPPPSDDEQPHPSPRREA